MQNRIVLIIGLGLMGGSVGMALRRRGWRVFYLDPDTDETLARERAAADARVTDARDRQLGEAIVMLATPVDAALHWLRSWPSYDQRLITSVASVMAPLQRLANERGLNFIAGHPFAGSQEQSIHAAQADLFEDKTWFLANEQDEPMLFTLLSDTGARVHQIVPEEHDRILALTSHLPQILSTALAAVLAGQNMDLELFGGSGLRTFLRLAGSSHSVWGSIIRENHDYLAQQAHEVAATVERIISMKGEEEFHRARAVYERLQRNRR